MPQIFDNIEKHLLDALSKAIKLSVRADFCVGYFNLRGWKQVDPLVKKWSGGKNHCCRLLVGMQRLPHEQLRLIINSSNSEEEIDQSTVVSLKKQLAKEFKTQLTVGVPSNEDEAGLRRLAEQIEAKKLVVKLFLRHPLHAKLYLLFREDDLNPIIGYLGSSNFTLAGLSKQGELNIDVLDHDACDKLSKWFEERWNNKFCMDISGELLDIINKSWARSEQISPYHIYIKTAYHLSQEVRSGLTEFQIPCDFGEELFDFQKAAVKIAAHHLNKRGGVVIGDVVGLGKTLMATVLARIFEEDYGIETLIICPKNLVQMWEDYRDRYRLRAKVLSIARVQRRLPELRRFRLVLIDESHNLRNRKGKRYQAIADYIATNDSRVILLSATPYNKTYLDLSNQLRLFIDEKKDIGIRPEKLLRELGEAEFNKRHQCSARSLAAFEKSEHPDDWRELMRLYLVRRTRSFIQDNYAKVDLETKRKYLELEDGRRSYFPLRVPKTVKFTINENDSNDQYACLFSNSVVDAVNSLTLPRYGLGNYEKHTPHRKPSSTEKKTLSDLSRAGLRLMGFCRTNLFKRLESSGHAFILSIDRHILRNLVYIYAIEENEPIPIGTQDASLLDTATNDTDSDLGDYDDESNEKSHACEPPNGSLKGVPEVVLRSHAAEIYRNYSTQVKGRFRWLDPEFFSDKLAKDLKKDNDKLMKVLNDTGNWNAERDTKLHALVKLLTEQHKEEKVIVFSQFADTVKYLYKQLKDQGVQNIACVTGDTDDPTSIVNRFSPASNEQKSKIDPATELRVVLATDLLSEGQNLQDCCIIVNYDLPWAIIRLIQRVGRVDRIGQQSDTIMCYSFLPADGVERIIRLRRRVQQRLLENAEVVGTDEAFFEDQTAERVFGELFTEKGSILDGDEDADVDLASYAYQIWKNAIDSNPGLEEIIPEMPNVIYSTKPHNPSADQPEGVLVYLRTSEGNDSLAWIDQFGNSVTGAQFAILKAAECSPETQAIPRHSKHHKIVAEGVKRMGKVDQYVGGQLGRPSGARCRSYERLKAYANLLKGTHSENSELSKAIEDIYKYPLLQTATDKLNRQLKSSITDTALADLVICLRANSHLCRVDEDMKSTEPQLICSLGLRKKG